MEPLLELRKVNKTFKKNGLGQHALKDISFSLYPGDWLGIVGESGSGKSTIARIVTGQIDGFDSGQVCFMGREIPPGGKKDLSWVYRDMQMVFQQPLQSFNPRLRLGNSVMEGMGHRGLSKAAAQKKMFELFEICGLSRDIAERFPHEVSGGECQRAAIARVMALNPKLVIFDEATSALDMAVQWQVLTLIGGLKEKFGLTYIFISHDIALIQSTCNRVMVMKEGEVIETGTREEVIENPQNEYTKMLIQSVLV